MKSLASLPALAVALLVSARDQSTETSRAAPMRPVLVAEAHYAPREQAQVLSGVVKARVESDLAFRIAGKMATRLVDMGALVHRATRWLGSTTPIFGSSSRKRRRNRVPRPPRSFRRKRKSGA